MHAMEKELSPSPRLERLPQGYPKLARFMAERDHVMFKQFRELAILDILYLQAELCDIRGRLRAKAVQDANQADDRQYFDRDWWQMRHSAELGLDGQQYQLTLEMRKKLREYCKPVRHVTWPSMRAMEKSTAGTTFAPMGKPIFTKLPARLGT